MELNTAMRYVMVRASAEAAAAKTKTAGVEHVFCGLLKLSEMDVDKIAPTSKRKATIQGAL